MSLAAPLRTGVAARVSWQAENAWLENLETALNALVTRCNAANGTSLQPVSLHSPQSVCRPLTAAHFDENMVAVRDCLNSLQAASAAQSFRADNPVVLFLRQDVGAPLTAWHRDTNYLTIQVCANTLAGVYDLLGV